MLRRLRGYAGMRGLYFFPIPFQVMVSGAVIFPFASVGKCVHILNILHKPAPLLVFQLHTVFTFYESPFTFIFSCGLGSALLSGVKYRHKTKPCMTGLDHLRQRFLEVSMQEPVVVYCLADADVVRAVAKAIEVLSAGGAKAIDYAADGRGWSDLTGNDNLAALSIWERVLMLPAEQNLALMWRVLRDDPRMGDAVLSDLACFVAHHIPDGNRFGREGLRYWVRHWARRDGSSREAAHLYGQSHVSHQRFYREQVALCLDRWFTAAKGALEQVVAECYGNYMQAA